MVEPQKYNKIASLLGCSRRAWSSQATVYVPYSYCIRSLFLIYIFVKVRQHIYSYLFYVLFYVFFLLFFFIRHEIYKRLQQARHLQLPRNLFIKPECSKTELETTEPSIPQNEIALNIPEPVVEINSETPSKDMLSLAEDNGSSLYNNSSRSSSPLLINANNLPPLDNLTKSPSPLNTNYQREASFAFLNMETRSQNSNFYGNEANGISLTKRQVYFAIRYLRS